MAGFRKHGNELPGPIKSGKFSDYVMDLFNLYRITAFDGVTDSYN